MEKPINEQNWNKSIYFGMENHPASIGQLNDAYLASLTHDVYNSLSASLTTLANTQLTLNYGVNVITTCTSSNFACKLPTPKTGRFLYVINKSTAIVKLFPSVAGGQINNYAIGAPASIPPDGKAYIFICTENPLPGAWTWNPPAIDQYDSGDITENTASTSTVISAVNASSTDTYTSFWGNTIWAVNGLNVGNYPSVLSDTVAVAFKPSNVWNSVVKIKVYTNLAYHGSNNVSFALMAGTSHDSYTAGTTTYVGITPGKSTVSGNFSDYGYVNQLVSGATLAAGTLTTNVGDPGTCWGELVLSQNSLNDISAVGTKYIGLDSNGDDYYTTASISFQIKPSRVLTGFKFRFFLEYN